MKIRFILLLGSCTPAMLAAQAQTAPSLSGTWSGTLGALTLTAHVQDPATGPRTATLDIPAQNAQGLPLQVKVKADSIYLKLAAANARFAGQRSADGQALTGEWQQAGKAFPLTLTRLATGAAALPNRPQTPKAPFPYKVQDITFTNLAAGVTLAGTLTTPAGGGPFPAVVLLTGSGSEDRNSTLFGHQPFAVLADYLTRRGVVVLRFDDRGVGQSGGTLAGTTSADYAADAQAALAFLRTQPKVAKGKVGLIGHSEGGTAALEAVSRQLGPDFVVLLAAPGVAGDELIVQQSLALARLHTTDPVQLASTEKTQRSMTQIVQQTPDNAQARTQLLALYNPTANPQLTSRLEPQLAAITSPAYRHLLADRPATTLPNVHCPVLALGGSKDVQVPAEANLAGIRQGLQAGGNHEVTSQLLPGLNHLFQTAATGSPAGYGTIEETFAPAALQAIGDWVVAHEK